MDVHRAVGHHRTAVYQPDSANPLLAPGTSVDPWHGHGFGLPPPMSRPGPLPCRAAVHRAAPLLDVVKAQLGAGSRLLDDLLLAPCLTTRDLLSLAATATWSRPYRNLLRDIKIKTWRDDVTPARLVAQKHLRTVHVGAAEVLGRLVVSLRGEEGASPGATVRRLILEWEEALEKDVRELGTWLAEGGSPLLEELDMSNATLDRAGASHVYRA
jgi:hypothetical protein